MLKAGFCVILAAAPAMAVQEETPCTTCTTVWYVDANHTTGTQNGTSWLTAYPDLQSAISSASSGDCIWVKVGDYYPTTGTNQSISFDIDKSLRIYGGFGGDELCLSNRAGHFSSTVLSGDIDGDGFDGDNSHTIVTVEGSGLDVLIDGFTISQAFNDASPYQGGGIRSTDGALDLRNCIIRDNMAGTGQAAGYGAGLYAEDSELDIVSCQFINNSMDLGGEGGAIWMGGVSSVLVPGAGTHIYNTIFEGNVGPKGGGFYVQDIDNGDEVLLMNCLFFENEAQNGSAGFLHEDDSMTSDPGRAFLVNCTMSDNNLQATSSVLEAEDSGTASAYPVLDVLNCIVYDNPSATSPAIVPKNGNPLVTVEYTIVEAGSPWDCNPVPDCTNQGSCTVYDCDPLLNALYKPGSNSPAVDKGNNNTLFNKTVDDIWDLDGDNNKTEDVPFDIAGRDRIQNGDIDRGVWERSP